MTKLSPQQVAAITDQLNQARCLEKRIVGNLELTHRLVKAIEQPEEGTDGAVPDHLEQLRDAIAQSLLLCRVSDVLSVITGTFVSLTTEVVRRAGHDTDREIKVDGGDQRDITIHAPKSKAQVAEPKALPVSAPQTLLMRLAGIAAECSDPDTTNALDALIANANAPAAKQAEPKTDEQRHAAYLEWYRTTDCQGTVEAVFHSAFQYAEQAHGITAKMIGVST